MRDMATDSVQLYVKDRVQTFVDNVVIESVQSATRRWHTPVLRQEDPVITRDRPWERLVYFSGSDYTVLRDPEDGLFKCWYEDYDPAPDGDWSGSRGITRPGSSRQCYAVSEDGITWVKPELDVYEEDGRKTNIVLGGHEYPGSTHALALTLDPHPPTAEERYRALFNHIREPLRPGRGHQVRSAHSADGIHWTVYDEVPSFGLGGSRLGDVSVLFYDEDAREFVHNTRHYAQTIGSGANPRTPRSSTFIRSHEPDDFAADNRRRIFQCRSHDMIHWSEPIVVAAPDDVADNLDESFYCMSQFRLGTVHLATVNVLRAVDNEMYVQLLVSRDGTRWSRTNKRQPFLAPRDEGNWDAHMVSVTSPPIVVGDELWFYQGGTSYHHDWWIFGRAEGMDHQEARDPMGGVWGLGLATLRKDGYAGLYSTRHREGIVVTRPLVTQGTKLQINARCAPGGSVRVEVADSNDDVIGSCSIDRNDPFTGDAVEHTVTWSGDPAIPLEPDERASLRKVRFYLRDAELFSFRFADLPAS